jgi:transposase
MERRTRVELFEQIRREYEQGIGTIHGVARKFGVHRRDVRHAIESAVPPLRKVSVRTSPTLDHVKPFIEAMLVADKTAPRKQRHTAHRIWTRLCQEQPQYPVAESTVRAYVRQRKEALGLCGIETCVPQCYEWGQEAQVDWYDAHVVLDGEQIKVQVFNMRSMKSGAAFHRAYLHATQQAFFDAHEAAFAYFGGVFHTLRYDNLGSAVKKVLRGHTRDEHTRFIAFRSHWHFSAEFCTVVQPHEKGGVEGEVGVFRRNHFVPLPQVTTLDALNIDLLDACVQDRARIIGDRRCAVGPLLEEERICLLPLPREHFDIAESHEGLVDGKGCVKTHRNWYSTPLRVGTKPTVRVLPSVIEVWHAGKQVACHARTYDIGVQRFQLQHYLDVFDKKPGALAGSRPLAQCRAEGLWPLCLDTFWQACQKRLGKHEGTRVLVDLLLLGREPGWSALCQAVESALAQGSCEQSVVRCLLLTPATKAPIPPLSPEDLGRLSRYERAMPEMSGYDQLLNGERDSPTRLGGVR